MPQEEPSPRHCLKCGYDLRGLPLNRCPECGEQFDPGDPRTFSGSVFTPWHPSPVARRTVFALAVLVMSVQVLAFFVAGLYSAVYFLVLVSCFTAILFPLLLVIFPIEQRTWLRIALAMFLLFPVLTIGDAAINPGWPFGYYGRMNIIRSYVASLPGVKAGAQISVAPGGDSDFRLRTIHFKIIFKATGAGQDIWFSDGPVWANYREVNAWYAAMFKNAQSGGGTTK